MVGPIAWLMAWALAGAGAAGPQYVREIEGWQHWGAQRLTADGGWLTVAGLVWLKQGKNSFGSDPTCDVVLPAHSAPPQAGVFVHEGPHVRVEVRPGVPVMLGPTGVKRMTLHSDVGGSEPDVLSLARGDDADCDQPGGAAGRAREGHEEPGAGRVQGTAILPDSSALPRRREFRRAPGARDAERAERARHGGEHAQPRLRHLQSATAERRRRSRCGSTPCWSRARRGCSSSSATRPPARAATGRAGRTCAARRRQGGAGFQPRLFAAVRVHAPRDLPATAPNNKLPAAIEAGEKFAGH